MLYSGKKDYLNLPNLNLIYSKLVNDKEFLWDMINQYSYLDKPNSPIADIKKYLNDVLALGHDFPSKLFDEGTKDFFKQVTLRYDNNSNKYKVDYRKARDFALFIIRYEKRKELKEKTNNVNNNDKKKMF